MRKVLFVAFAIFFVGCKGTNSDVTKSAGDVLTMNVDSTIKPGEDFFLYANGGWIKNNPIPGEESSWGLPNLVLNENLSRLRKINEDAVKENAAKGTSSQKIADFWSTAMDSVKIEQVGAKPLQPYFDKINSINDIQSLLHVAAELNGMGVRSLFYDDVEQDEKNSSVMSYHIYQGGIGLPDREYYFKPDSSTVNIRNQYLKHITKFLVLQGQDSSSAAKSAGGILGLETKLAAASKKREDLRDPDSNYNKIAVSDMGKLNSVLN